MAFEKIEFNYYGVPAEVVYSPAVKEVVFWINPKHLDIDPFIMGHKTFTGISPETWRKLKVQLTSACSRPATAAINNRTLPAKVS